MHETSDVQTEESLKPGGPMITVLKWIAAVLVAGFLWLVGMYTDEYFRPYKKIRARVRNK
jgi:hypothetical protein